MTTTLRLNDDLKRDCDAVLEDIGLNFTSAISIFMREIVRTGSIPFPLRSSWSSERQSPRRRFMAAVDRIRAESSVNHEREWTMDEIDAEIAASRRERS